ncbi:Tyrosine type site-specific recombinase [Mucinivorans hirudinis]|uniref:Tyrosine type site-specific recombinase n=1 Tax=Mucinivorans hirudinis TaxID=1433126 RepID=A0A060RAE8_9BACT|nr:Tyrosine type site-specific recombinase [Mucinivorans hirudinis]
MEEKKVVTLETVRNRYYGNDAESAPEKTICSIYAEHNEKCRALIGIDFTQSTVEKFDTSLHHLKEFVTHHYHKDDLPLSQVNGEFVRGLDFFLKTVHKCKQNSTIKHLKNLKKIVRIALVNEWMKKDPFYGIQFKHEEVNVEFLTNEELQRIINKEITLTRLAQVRDVFVFCCYTGLAFIDVQQLTHSHITTDVNGATWIRKNRQKTGTMCNIPVLSKAQEIIERYSNHPQCLKKGVLLPVMANQNMNAYLKEIADLCEIKKRLSTHVARHTCATTVMLANNVRMENVSKILGHSSTKMTQHYAKVLDSSIMQDMAHVEKKMANL